MDDSSRNKSETICRFGKREKLNNVNSGVKKLFLLVISRDVLVLFADVLVLLTDE